MNILFKRFEWAQFEMVWQVDGANEGTSNLKYNTVATNIARFLPGENINQRNKNNESDNNYCIGCVCMYAHCTCNIITQWKSILSMKERERNTATVVGFIMILIFFSFFRFGLYVRFHCFFGGMHSQKLNRKVKWMKIKIYRPTPRFVSIMRFALLSFLFCFFKCADVLFRRYIFVKWK